MRSVPTPLLPIVLVLAATATAQDAVRLSPGHPDLTPVRPDDSVLAVYDGSVGGPRLGTVTRTVTPLADGAVSVVTDADAPRAGLASRDSAVYRPDLTPLVIDHDRGRAGTGRATIRGSNASGAHLTRDRQTRSFDIDLPQVPFDPAAVPLVARSLPFGAGYTAIVPTFSPIHRLREVTLTVVGQEEVTGADGASRTTWVIQETRDRGGSIQEAGSQDRRFFVDGATRDLVKTTIALRAGVVVTLAPATADQPTADRDARPIHPEDAPLDPSRLRSYAQTYRIRVVEPMQQDMGTTSRTLTVDDDARTATLVTTSRMGAMDGVVLRDSSVASWPSLQPLSRTITHQETRIELVFSDRGLQRTVSGSTVEPNETTLIDLDGPAFDENWVGELIRMLPLEDGYATTVESVGSKGVPAPVRVSVDALNETDASARVWRVRTTSDDGWEMTYDIDDSTREVLRTRRSPQVGVVLEFEPSAPGGE